MIKPGEAIMILELHRQGLSVSAIARGLEPPLYGPRQPRPGALDPFIP